MLLVITVVPSGLVCTHYTFLIFLISSEHVCEAFSIVSVLLTIPQEELNISAYGWATLAMETEPKVLSTLMWIWLEKLKVRNQLASHENH